MNVRPALVLVACGVMVAGCISPSAGTVSGASSDPGAPALEAVSKTAPNKGASGALDACVLTDTTGRTGNNGPFGIGLVSRMGLVPHARDIPKYAPFGPNVPEFQNDKPAWVIQISGTLLLPLDDNELKDPTCVVIDGEPIWFNTGAEVQPDGSLSAARTPKVPPVDALPALAP